MIQGCSTALKEQMFMPDYQNSRRSFLNASGLQLGSIALAELLNGTAQAATHPSSAQTPHFTPQAKHVIYLHMIGAPSQLDLYDEKPELRKRHNEPCPPEVTKGRDFAFIGKTSTLAGSPWKFLRHGESGQNLSELLPHLGTVADEIAVIRSLHSEEINHAPAQMFLHSGFGRGGRPSFGSWVTYGLGSDNADLPAYVVLVTGANGGAGTSLWSTGFLPSIYQGIPFRSTGDPVLFLSSPDGHDRDDRRRVLDAVGKLNQQRFQMTGDPEIQTRIGQYEMAFRMQASVPELMNINEESKQTLNDYGAQPGKASFANNCLLARRLVERGVRLVELYDSDWDHHGGIETRLPAKCNETDRPIAALIRDLKQRGLLKDTLIIWGAEFGRTPLNQGSSKGKGLSGRDHHKDAFTMWLAGGGIKGGVSYGQTDDFGMDIVEKPVHVHDLNATILHLLGINHERLTYRYQGREFRLTDVHGRVVQVPGDDHLRRDAGRPRQQDRRVHRDRSAGRTQRLRTRGDRLLGRNDQARVDRRGLRHTDGVHDHMGQLERGAVLPAAPGLQRSYAAGPRDPHRYTRGRHPRRDARLARPRLSDLALLHRRRRQAVRVSRHRRHGRVSIPL